MAVSSIDQIGRLLKGRELQFKAVAITALCSYFLQLIGILLHWALWAIALGTIIPWIPLLTMKVFWSSKHYGFMAFYLCIMILQAGHVGEHVVQMLQFIFIYNPHANPPCLGWSWNGGCGDAHGVFGELDRELVHFVWDGLILVATIVVRIYFRKSKNIWLTLAIVAAAVHQVEHIYLYGNYVFNNFYYVHGNMPFLGITVKNVPEGLLGYNGVLGSAFPAINSLLPGRINLHFIYNTLVLIPMVLAFRKQLQYVYDEWLAKAMPQLSEEQLIAATAQAENVKFNAGQIIFRQGDPADKFYIITQGQVDITRQIKKDGQEVPVGRLSEGMYFGEIELLGKAERSVTAKAVTVVECLTLNRDVFKSLLAASAETYKEMDVVLRRRLAQLGALQGLPANDTVTADQETILKTRMIRDRLKMLQGEDVSRILGRMPVAAAPAVAQQPQPVLVGAAVGANGAANEANAATLVRPVRANSPAPAQNGYRRGTLVVRTGPAAGQRFEINAPRMIVGRRSATEASSDVPMIYIDDARISRHHFELVAQPDGLYVRDLGSANGTWLNGRQVGGEPVRLENGAELQVGPDTVLNYRV